VRFFRWHRFWMREILFAQRNSFCSLCSCSSPLISRRRLNDTSRSLQHSAQAQVTRHNTTFVLHRLNVNLAVEVPLLDASSPHEQRLAPRDPKQTQMHPAPRVRVHTVHYHARGHYLWARWRHFTSLHTLSSRCISVLFSHLCIGLLSGLFPSGFPNNTVFITSRFSDTPRLSNSPSRHSNHRYKTVCSLLLLLPPSNKNKQTNSMVWVRERTIPTERPPLVNEVIANFCG
jgi:hypothetical protein